MTVAEFHDLVIVRRKIDVAPPPPGGALDADGQSTRDPLAGSDQC